MKAKIILAVLIAFCTQGNFLSAQTLPVKRSKQQIINFLGALIANQKIMVGQHCETGANTVNGYINYVTGLKTQTGRYPYIIGLEYGYTANNNLDLINSYATKQWDREGLITISWHVHNPWGEGYNCRWNSIKHQSEIDFYKLLKSAPESAEKTSYRDELLKVATSLQKLQDQDIVVLWRPFHEMNGDWFWWGINKPNTPTNRDAFAALWHDMYDTFTQDFGLKNLIWVYSPNQSNNTTAPVNFMYPGDDFVDVVGLDIYSDKPQMKQDDYLQLKAFNKPFVIAEIGPSKVSYGTFDEMELVDNFKGKAAYFLQWNGWKGVKMGIIDNTNFKKMMLRKDVLTVK